MLIILKNLVFLTTFKSIAVEDRNGDKRKRFLWLSRLTRSMKLLVLPAALFFLLLNGCDNFMLSELLDGELGKALSISPTSTVLPAFEQVTFLADGGAPPYTFAITTAGSGSPTIGAGTGLYIAGATPGSDTVRVTDSAGGVKDAVITITAFAGALGLSPSSITLNVNSNVTFTAVGGTPPYTFAITTAGSGSPTIGPGTGLYIAGATPGTDTVQVTDFVATTANATVTVTNISSSVDYTVPVTNFPATGTAGTAIPGGFDFTIQNSGSAAGSQTVTWKVYISANGILDSGDTIISSGSIAALASGGTNVVPLTGTWPVFGGPYFLIAEAVASDDLTTGNNVSGAGAITLNPPNIDYSVTVVNNTGGTTTGAAIAGNFTVNNGGADNGSQPVYWTAYVSTDTILDGSDPVIDSGSTAALNAGASSGAITFSGTWPGTPATYYLIVQVAASDDVNGANNDTASAGVSVTAPPAPNYNIAAATIQTSGAPSALFTAAGVHDFTIQEVSGNAGNQTIDWAVYISTDQILDGGDTLEASGSEAALAGSGSVVVPFDGTWPGAGRYYYLIIKITADDDSDPINDMRVSSVISVPVSYTEGAEDNSDIGPTPPAFTAAVSDYAITLNVDSLVEINGTMDTYDQYDTYKFTAGAGVNSVEIYATWATGFDDIDLYLWDESGANLSTLQTGTSSEPSSPPWTITGLTPGNNYYVGVNFYLDLDTSGSAGQPYKLYLYGKP